MSRYKNLDDVMDENKFDDLELPEDRDLETESADNDDDDIEPYDREDFYNGRDDYWDDEE
jgi:hypothetical protein